MIQFAAIADSKYSAAGADDFGHADATILSPLISVPEEAAMLEVSPNAAASGRMPSISPSEGAEEGLADKPPKR